MKLGLFFTLDVSLELWESLGILDREKLIYEKLLDRRAVDEVFWFTYGPNDKSYEPRLRKGIVVVPLPRIFAGHWRKILYSFLAPLFLGRYLRDTDVIKTNQMRGSWVAVLAKLFYRKPLVVRTGFTWSRNAAKRRLGMMDRFATLIEKIAYRACDAAIVSDATQAQYIQARYGLAPERVSVVPNYIDVETFRPSPAAERFQPGRIVYVGRLSVEKNLENLVAALAGLPYGVDLYGDGPLKQALMEKAGKLGADVRFLGAVANARVPEILNLYPAFILPSWFEGSPKSLLEAMACGLACIGTAVDGIRDDVIRHGDTGWLVGTDADAIRSGIRAVMADESLRKRLGENARRFIVERFSLDQVERTEAAIHAKVLVNQK